MRCTNRSAHLQAVAGVDNPPVDAPIAPNLDRLQRPPGAGRGDGRGVPHRDVYRGLSHARAAHQRPGLRLRRRRCRRQRTML